MSRIAMLLDVEEGHFLATFKLAKDLRARGHSIHYLGLGSAEGLVREQGFEFVPVLTETLSGTRAAHVENATPPTLARALLAGGLDEAFGRLRPDGLILLSLYYLEALLIERRYRLPLVLLTPHYRSEARRKAIEKAISGSLLMMDSDIAEAVVALIAGGDVRMRSFRDVAELLRPIPELVLLPRAFDLPELAGDPDVIYIGAGVDLARAEEPFPWQVLDPHLPLIYCSLGSQADFAADVARRFFACVIEAAAARLDLQFVLSIGRGFSPADFPARSPNLYVSDWVPQVTVLGRACVMVNHGGAGTVKECILRGVPMVVMPLMRDQFDCARRVVHHGLGVEGDLQRLSAGGLLALVDTVEREPAFRRRVVAMRQLFLEDDGAQLGARLVEAAICARRVSRSA